MADAGSPHVEEAEANEPYCQWRGFRIVLGQHTAKLTTHDNEALSETVGNLEGTEYFDANERPKGEWIITEALARGTNYLMTPDDQQLGFTYKVPYMSNMDYGAELYAKLYKFAKAHPKDKFNAQAMLFTCELYTDILQDNDLLVERSASGGSLPKPEILPLSIFLAYYETWLKVHEYLRCIQYTHPFRVIRTMYQQDLGVDAWKFAIKTDMLDNEDMMELVGLGIARRPELPAS